MTELCRQSAGASRRGRGQERQQQLGAAVAHSPPEALKPPFCIANSLLVLLPEAPPPLAALATSLCRPRQVFVGRALNHSSQEEGPASNNARCRASKS
eukprot:CAMPEP_0179204118 /NCGR_PEP_ID=MMETSP0796-20121207/101753_1 /TAXON_ID=73915 /ORGANISM="Pyrodinium bahamense, Strain pbaha01" /LENGTH=97 /DNA_ID=CAMNT_0020908995 /DNA_START=146 /DNA_END=439 /DNA_ORIENTATION=-